jgi:hypothetical protein
MALIMTLSRPGHGYRAINTWQNPVIEFSYIGITRLKTKVPKKIKLKHHSFINCRNFIKIDMKTEIVKIAKIGFLNGSITHRGSRKLAAITLSLFFVSITILTDKIILFDIIMNLVSDSIQIGNNQIFAIALFLIVTQFLFAYPVFWYILHLNRIIFHAVTKRNIYLIKCETGHLEICISYGSEPPLLNSEKYKDILLVRILDPSVRNQRSIYTGHSKQSNFDFFTFFPEINKLRKWAYQIKEERMYRDYSNVQLNETYITFDGIQLKEYLTKNKQIEYKELLRFLINQYIDDHHSINLFSNEIDFISDNAYNTFENEVKHLISDKNIDYCLSIEFGVTYDPDDIEKTVDVNVLHSLKKAYPEWVVWNYLNSRHPLAELSREALEDKFKV